MNFKIKYFNELTSEEVYDIIKLRTEVFIKEQGCSPEDLDDKDKECYHIFAYDEGRIVGYSRILGAGLAYAEPSIGRVAVAKEYRGTGIGHEMMQRVIDFVRQNLKEDKIKISAQAHAIKFYQRLGFEIVSEEYLEENIPHVKMILDLV